MKSFDEICSKLKENSSRRIGPEFVYPFVVLLFATILRKILRVYRISIPYTVMLMLVGAVLGAFYRHELVKRFLFIADLTPVQILTIFLPILIFESAFSCEPHIFIRSLGQILILAILGFFISVGLTTFAVMFWYENERNSRDETCWTWDQAILYSSVVSATDPVSVVSLLKTMSSLKTLSTVIEGESLLNDAAAITVYTLIKDLIEHSSKEQENVLHENRATLLGANAKNCDQAERFLIEKKITIFFLVKFVLKTIVGAIFIGYSMARISIFVLYRIEAGELETCLTIAMSYFVYLMCESIEASGVIGVVLLGLTLNMNRACFSVSAIDISERTWQLLSYIANALIFMTVGVILLKTHSGTEKLTSLLTSIPQLLLVYIILTVVRALMIFSVHFILKRIAYGFTWKDATITIWSGLRGGVSLVLALTLFNSPIKDQYQAETLLIHTIAIVFLTCTVNALTIPVLIKLFGMNRRSELIEQTINQAVREVKSKQIETIERLKRNSVFASADWFFVEKSIGIDFCSEENSEKKFVRRQIDEIKCERCRFDVTIPVSKFEFEENFENFRIRTIRLKKNHFWSKFYNEQISSSALESLNALCDRTIDKKNDFLDFKPVEFSTRSIFLRFRNSTRRIVENFQLEQIFLRFSNFFLFVELIFLVFQLVRTSFLLQTFSFFFFLFHFFQIFRFFRRAEKNRFFLFFFFFYVSAIFLRILSSIFFFTSSQMVSTRFFLQLSAIFFQFFVFLLSSFLSIRTILDFFLNRQIKLDYDLALAHLSAEEELLKTLHRLTDNETIRNRVREHSIQQIRKAMDHVVQLQENHPGTVTSIKTRQTINFLLKTTEKSIDKLRSSGFLDSEEFAALKTSLKKQKGQVQLPSTIVAPKSIDALRKCLWLFESEKINENQRRIIVENLRSIEIKNFSWKDFLWRKEQSSNGVFLIVYGLVEEWRLYPYDIDAATLENRRKNNFRSSDELFTEENRTKTIENPMVDMSSLQDGFYARWNRIVSANLEPVERSNSEHFGLEDFDENFENFSFSHPTSSSDKIHRCFSFSENETVGFYDFLVNRTDKYRSTVKSLTNSTTFFIEKEKLVEIFDRFDLWKIVWLEFAIDLFLTIFYEKFPRAIEQVLNSALLVLSDDQTELNLDQDIFLVSGSLKNLSSKAIYEAPIFVDRSLSRDKLEIIETVSTTKILLFPNAEVNRIVLDLFTDKKLTKSLIDRHQRKQKRFACQQNRSQENSRGNHFILTNVPSFTTATEEY